MFIIGSVAGFRLTCMARAAVLSGYQWHTTSKILNHFSRQDDPVGRIASEFRWRAEHPDHPMNPNWTERREDDCEADSLGPDFYADAGPGMASPD